MTMLGDTIYSNYSLKEGKIARMQVASPVSDAEENLQIPRRRFPSIEKAPILYVYFSDLAIESYRIVSNGVNFPVLDGVLLPTQSRGLTG